MKKYLAELIGTFILTFTACGAASFTGGYAGYLGVVGIAFIFGLTAAVLVYMFGTISGAHCNPAVSLGMLLARRISLMDFMGYVVAQVLGGIGAGFALYGLSKSFNVEVVAQYQSYGYDLVGLGTNGYESASAFLQISAWGAFAVEVFLTFFFVLTFLAVTAKTAYKNAAGIVIGMAYTTVQLFGITLTGAGVNPARSFGPALAKAVFGDVTALSQVWVFILAPLAGGILAALCYIVFYSKRVRTQQVQSEELPEKMEEVELIEEEKAE